MATRLGIEGLRERNEGRFAVDFKIGPRDECRVPRKPQSVAVLGPRHSALGTDFVAVLGPRPSALGPDLISGSQKNIRLHRSLQLSGKQGSVYPRAARRAGVRPARLRNRLASSSAA